MAKFEVQTPGYTYYFETQKVRGKQLWALLQRGVHVADISESVKGKGYLQYQFKFIDGGSNLTVTHDSVEKAIRFMANHHGERLRGGERIYADAEGFPPDIYIPIPDLAIWDDSVLAENLAIYKAEPPDAYIDRRIAELTEEIERRANERAQAERPADGLRTVAPDGTLSRLGELSTPPLTIQFGEIGGLRLETVKSVSAVLGATAQALENLGYRLMAEQVRKMLETGIAPIRERAIANG